MWGEAVGHHQVTRNHLLEKRQMKPDEFVPERVWVMENSQVMAELFVSTILESPADWILTPEALLDPGCGHLR